MRLLLLASKGNAVGGDADMLAALGWWLDAGVDAFVDETGRDWLAVRPAATATPATSAPLPDTLAALQMLIGQGAAADGAPIMPVGDPAGGVMLLADMPAPLDTPATGLFAGAEGRLLDAMLAAIGRDRASIYLATLVCHRAFGRPLDDTGREACTHLARRHVALVAPKVLLLLGDGACETMLGAKAAQLRGRIHAIDCGDVTVNGLATFHPQTLLKRPAAKAEAWADLRRLLEVLNR